MNAQNKIEVNCPSCSGEGEISAEVSICDHMSGGYLADCTTECHTCDGNGAVPLHIHAPWDGMYDAISKLDKSVVNFEDASTQAEFDQCLDQTKAQFEKLHKAYQALMEWKT